MKIIHEIQDMDGMPWDLIFEGTPPQSMKCCIRMVCLGKDVNTEFEFRDIDAFVMAVKRWAYGVK